MEFSDCLSFLIVVNESIKLLPKNGKLMATVTLLSMAFSTFFYLLLSFFLKSLMADMFIIFTNAFMPDPSSFMPDPSSFNQDPASFTPSPSSFMPDPTGLVGELAHLRQDFGLLLVVLVVGFLASSIISLFSTIATTLVSAMSYKDKTLSLKDLCLGIARTWKKTIITGFYVSLHSMGYLFFIASLAVPLLMYSSTLSIVVAILIAVAGLIFYLHLLVVWILAILVPVTEESTYGFEALGKAAALVKGKRFCGIMINLCFNVLVGIVFQCYRLVLAKMGPVSPIVYGVLVVNFAVLEKIFLVVVYTVLHLQCKKSHGEEIELHGSIEYSKLPTTYPTEKS